MKEVLEFLDSKNVKYELREHEEVHTMEDMENLGLLDKGIVLEDTRQGVKWKRI